MDLHRREFLCSAGATLLGAAIETSAQVAAGAPNRKPIGWRKWSASGQWLPVFSNDYPGMPYAVVACYEHQAI